MRILLVQPHTPASTISTDVIYLLEPLGLEYVAAGVDGEHQIEILDMRIEPDFAKTLRSYKPDIVGITAYTLHVNVAKQILKQAKQWNDRVLTVVGGHHATVAPEDSFEPQVDVVVIGDGVFAFRDVVRSLERRQTLEEIPGIAFRSDSNGFIRTPLPPHPELRKLPLWDVPGVVYQLGKRFKRLRALHHDCDNLPDFEAGERTEL